MVHRLRERTLRYEVVMEVEVVRPKGGARWQEVRTKLTLQQEEKGRVPLSTAQ